MSWAKLDDGFCFNAKVLAAGNAGAGVFARALTYCAQQGTDGRVPDDAARVIAGADGQAVLDRLVEVRLWERVGGGYAIPDYLDYNPPADTSRARREQVAAARREAGRKGGQRSGESRRSKREANEAIGSFASEANAKQTGSKRSDFASAKTEGSRQDRSKTEAPSRPHIEKNSAAVVRTTGTTGPARPVHGPGGGAERDPTPEPSALDHWELRREMQRRAGGALDCAVYGALERTFVEARRDLAAQGYGDADWLGLAEMAAAGDLAKHYRGPPALAPMLGRPEGDGERAAAGLLFALRLQRSWRAARARAAAHPPPPPVPAEAPAAPELVRARVAEFRERMRAAGGAGAGHA